MYFAHDDPNALKGLLIRALQSRAGENLAEFRRTTDTCSQPLVGFMKNGIRSLPGPASAGTTFIDGPGWLRTGNAAKESNDG